MQESKYNVGLDAAILMNREVWVASGHVTSFNDPLMDCKACKARFRADKLIEDFTKDWEHPVTGGRLGQRTPFRVHRRAGDSLPRLRQEGIYAHSQV